MATYWIASDGNDDNDGLSYDNRKATWGNGINAAVAASVGNTVNVVGNLEIGNTEGATVSGLVGATDFDTGFGLRIQATDSGGSAAESTLTFQDSTTATTALALGANANYVDVRGFKVDWSGLTSTVTTKHWMVATGSGKARFQACHWLGGGVGATGYGSVINANITDLEELVVQYCVLEDITPGAIMLACDERGTADINHVVFILPTGDWASATVIPVNWGNNDADPTDHSCIYCTFYVPSGASATSGFVPISSTDTAPFSATPDKTVHSNIIYYGSTMAGGMTWMAGGGGTQASWNVDLGYVLFADGVGSQAWSGSDYPWEDPWDPGDVVSNNLWTGDQLVEDDPFFDKGTAWDWENVNSLGYDLSIIDLRCADTYRTDSKAGDVPGAINDAIAVPEIDGSDLTISASIDAGVTDNVVINNLGTGDLTITNVVLAAVDDSGGTITFSGPTTATISAGNSANFPVTFTPVTIGTTATATLTFTNDDDDEGTFVINITGRTSSFWIPDGKLPARPISPDFPAHFGRPGRDEGSRVSIFIHKNTEIEWAFTTFVGGWSDTATNVFAGIAYIGTNSSLATIPGLQAQDLNKIMIEPQFGESLVQINSHTFLLRDGGCFLLANSTDLNTVKMSNPSTIRDIRVHVFASGGNVTASAPQGKRSAPTKTVDFL
jgi:hypothetical protein